MNRAQVISRILEQRRDRADELDGLDDTVARLREGLTELDTLQATIRSRVDPETGLLLEQIAGATGDLLRRVDAARRDNARTDARFRRPYITIGAVGRSGQGKSRFLQSLTGLTDQEIPAARGGFMTGVPSIIRPATGPTVAEVELHDETSFISDVLSPYYAELGLGTRPDSLDAFARNPLPALAADASNRHSHAYAHLRSYHEHLPEYRQHLESPTRIVPIAPDEILRYVAQHDQAGKPSHDFRAVRRVRVTAPFPQQDLESLAVIDLPGLGDTNLHDEHLLRQALDGEVDVVLFIRRPDPIRDDVHDYDVALYDVARSALPELPIEQRSFFVLNRVDGPDGDNAAGLARYAGVLRRSGLRVIDVAEANCASPQEVAATFDTIVGQAVRVVDELDRTLIARRRQDVTALLAEAVLLVSEARAVTGRAVPSGSWFLRFQELFNHTYEQLAVALDELVDELCERTTESAPRLAAEIEAAIGQARTTIVAPSIEEIKTRRAVEGSYAAALSLDPPTRLPLNVG
ncbi:hypothetical protein EDC02_7236 [Micromonospora sp. Llam0]|uniref:GTPase domain-containing protein n=1 Tax=Micromonospora sp. Llam0 TaxID=2485143 RepID=UPI000F463DE5|nr:GTPase domain-containing protein [Micromonospora sp. Llam0]ROO52315.1 hypothetical protein EDC02_7236 [Micromonospora sp. Llam0]